MAVVKAVSAVVGGYRQVAATDQIQCDAGAMTVTETGGSAAALPDALAAKAAIASVLAIVGGVVPTSFPPRRGQFFKALEAYQSGSTAIVTAAVPADPGNATNIAFNHTTFVLQSCTLAQFVKSTLALNDAQLAAIMTAARSMTE